MDYVQLKNDLLNLNIEHKGVYGSDPLFLVAVYRAKEKYGKQYLSKEWVMRDYVSKFFEIAYKDWFEVEKGEWGRSDDGFVMKCVRMYTMKRKANADKYVRKVFHYPVSRRFCSFTYGVRTSKDPFNVMEFLSSGNLGAHSPLTRSQRWVKQRHVQKGLYLWAKLYYLRGGKLGWGDCHTILGCLRPRKYREVTDPQAYLDWFIGKHVEIRNYAGLMLKKVFEENGLGATKVAEMLETTFETAKAEKNVKVMHEVAKTVLDVHETPTVDVEVAGFQIDNRSQEIGFEKMLNEGKSKEIVISEDDYKDAVNNMQGGTELAILANEHAHDTP